MTGNNSFKEEFDTIIAAGGPSGLKCTYTMSIQD